MDDGTSGRTALAAWRGGLVAIGALVLVGAAALGFAPLSHPSSRDNTCGAVFDVDAGGESCAGSRRALGTGIGVGVAVGVVLVVAAFTGRVRGARLALAGALLLGTWIAGAAATARLLHYDRCGSVTTPADWPPRPPPDGPTQPEGCGAALDGRTAQAVGLAALAAAQLGAVVALVVRAPSGRRTHRAPAPV